MTDTPPKPKRRRWRWLVVGMALLSGASFLWSHYRAMQLVEWIEDAKHPGLMVSRYTTCRIGGLAHNEWARKLLPMRYVTIRVFDTDGADVLIRMRDCPVASRLVINAKIDLPDEMSDQLFARFHNNDL